MRGISSDLPSPEEERDLLMGAALEAGHAIMPLFRDTGIGVWSKDDSSPVSEADLRANNVLREALLSGRRGDYGWLSEESAEDPDRTDKRRTLIVDPIDGTRAFLKGQDEFTVCLAVCEGGDILASVIYAPAKDEMFSAAKGAGAFFNGSKIMPSRQSALEGCRMIGAPMMFGHPKWPRPWPAMNIAYKNSTSYRIALVAAGQFDATIALAPKADWDTAPGTLIAQEAGAVISDHLGRSFTFCRDDPVQPGLVCSAEPLYPQLLERLDHLPSDLRTI